MIGKLARRFVLVFGIGLFTFTNSGCTLFHGLGTVIYSYMLFWQTTPLILVSPYFSQKVEDAYHEDARYNKVPIFDPVEGEHAPLFCMDPPSPDEVVRALPTQAIGGYAFLAETSYNNVRVVVEPMVDRVDECRFFPLVGPAKMHHCHYKCTVYFDKTIRSSWPIPFTHHDDQSLDVVYIDHDHLIRCAGPPTPK